MSVKGNLIVGQSGGPTVVINQSLVGVVEEALKHPCIQGVYGMRHGLEGAMKEDFVDLRRESRQTLEDVAATPSAALGSCRFKPKEDDCRAIFKIFEKHNIRYFFYIGGNDSALSAGIINKIAQQEGYDLRVFHCPKTIDNDLLVTDHCPGYGSAAKYVAQAFMGNDMDNRAIPGVKIDVCMGRNAGWLTAAAALAKVRPDDGPHLIYLPERGYTLAGFLDDVAKVYAANKRAMVAVSEGIADNDGTPFIESDKIRAELKELGMESILASFDAAGKVEEASGGAKKDAFGHTQLSGTGTLADFLASAVKIHMFRTIGKKIRCRADTLGYAQRSFAGVASVVDQLEARDSGRAAVRTAVEGRQSGSIVFKRLPSAYGKYLCDCDCAPLEDVSGVNFPKGVKQYRPMDDKFIAAWGNDVTQEFIDWARPLLGDLAVKGSLDGYKVG
ncbi:MAG: 6-phosphofructokinase [Candidatus Sumerlaeia bacterium]|nr:6-phosphofructokinase [Candidatus Sumerlaeia bacterium]